VYNTPVGKKRISALGSENEAEAKSKHQRQLEQKKLRKTTKAPGLAGGQRVIDTTQESLREYEEIQKRTSPTASTPQKTTAYSVTRGRLVGRSKSYQSAKSKIDVSKTYSLPGALALLRRVTLTKFDPTVELHLTLTNPSQSKLSVNLPHSFGKARKIAIATDEVIAKIGAGQIDFDILVASPDQMGKLVKYAKVLGPKGLMPNPKTQTISPHPEEAAKKLSLDTSLPLKLDKTNSLVIHTSIGKLSYPDKNLSENISAVLSTVSGNTRKVVLKSTMSPAIKLNIEH